MRNKKDLYNKEKDQIIDKIITLLNLDKDNSIILYDLDNDIYK